MIVIIPLAKMLDSLNNVRRLLVYSYAVLSPQCGSMPGVLDSPEIEDDILTQMTSRVILFNDEWHTFDEVIEQIIKAIGCNYDKAEALTLEVHNAGKAMVYDGDFVECLRVSNILEEIHLRTQIEC